jgi:hypothetical protein
MVEACIRGWSYPLGWYYTLSWNNNSVYMYHSSKSHSKCSLDSNLDRWLRSGQESEELVYLKFVYHRDSDSHIHAS